MFALLGIVGMLLYTGVAALGYRQRFLFNEYNLELSALAALLFFAGSLYGIYILGLIRRGERALQRLPRDPVASRQDAEHLREKISSKWLKERFDTILRESKFSSDMTNSGEIVDDLQSGIELIYFSASTALFIGLLGTLLGIVQAIGVYRNSLSGSLATPELVTILAGLDKAFGTTILGIVASVILSFLGLLCQRAYTNIAASLHGFMADYVAAALNPSVDFITSVIEKSIMRTLPSTIREVSEQLLGASARLDDATSNAVQYATYLARSGSILQDEIVSLREYQSRLISSAEAISEQARATLEGNEKLLKRVVSIDSLIQKTDVALAEMSSALKMQAQVLGSMSHDVRGVEKSLSEFPEEVRKLGERFDTSHREERSHSLRLSQAAEKLATAGEKLSIAASTEPEIDRNGKLRAAIESLSAEGRRGQRVLDNILSEVSEIHRAISSVDAATIDLGPVPPTQSLYNVSNAPGYRRRSILDRLLGRQGRA